MAFPELHHGLITFRQKLKHSGKKTQPKVTLAVLNVCVCLYLFSQQEDDHCFIIQDIEDQCREGLIMQNYDHLFLQSRYLFSARRSKKRLKLDCQFENKYINTTCFVREVTLLRICRSFCPEIFKTAKFFGDGSTPRKKDSVSELTENNALW